MCAKECLYISEDNLQDLVFSFSHVEPGIELRFMHLFCVKQYVCMTWEVGSGTYEPQQNVWRATCGSQFSPLYLHHMGPRD